MRNPILKSRISNIKARVPITIPLIIAEGKKNQNTIFLIMSRPTAQQAIIVRTLAGIHARHIAIIDRRAASMSAAIIPRLNAQTAIQIRVKLRSMAPSFCSALAKPIAIPKIAPAIAVPRIIRESSFRLPCTISLAYCISSRVGGRKLLFIDNHPNDISDYGFRFGDLKIIKTI